MQTLKFDVYTAAEEEGDRLDTFQGSMICLLSDLCRAPGRTLTRPVLQQKRRSYYCEQDTAVLSASSAMLLTVDAEEQGHQNSSLRVKMKVRGREGGREGGVNIE